MNEITQDAELIAALNEKPKPAPTVATMDSPNETRKLAAFLPEQRSIAGRKLQPYTMGRKLILRRTGNELLRLRDHALAYAAKHDKQYESLTDADWFAAIGEIPQLDEQAVAFLYVLWADMSELMAQSRSPEKFQAAVFAFADNLRGGERGIMPLVLDILVESAAGNDYEVTGDASASPN